MAKGQAPDYRISYVREERGQRRWVPCGAAWKHDDGDGFSIMLDALPLNFNGELVARPPYQPENGDATS